VVTDDGALGPLRLHLLKQNWIARGGASAADPAPYATVGPVPDAPRWLATALQHAVSALPIIAIYALLAAAYALVYGLVGRINLAFGELTVLAGYGAFLGFSALGGDRSLLLGLLGALAMALYTGISQGAALGRWLIAPLSGRPGQHVLIATIGLSLFWSELVRLTQGADHRWMGPVFNRPLALARSGDFVVTVTPMALLLPALAVAAAAVLLLVMQRTAFGRRWRAFADDPKAAELLGTDPQRLVLATMGLASACAALAGLLTTLYYGGVGFAGGQLIGLKALIAAIIGGVGSVPGALLGGVLLGLAETIWSAAFTIDSRDPAVFLLLVLLLAVRPEGVLGIREEGRALR
jgi:branched-chain amino acid transport system permease protein